MTTEIKRVCTECRRTVEVGDPHFYSLTTGEYWHRACALGQERPGTPLEVHLLQRHARSIGYVAVPKGTWEGLVTALEEMDGHFKLLMDGLRYPGSSWNAADARRAQAHSALAAAAVQQEAIERER